MFCQAQGTSYANLPIVFCQAQGTSQANLPIVSSSPIKAQVNLICLLSFVWPKAHVSKAILPIVKPKAQVKFICSLSFVRFKAQVKLIAYLPIMFCQACHHFTIIVIIFSSQSTLPKLETRGSWATSLIWATVPHNTEAWAYTYVLLHRLVTNSITMKNYYLLKQK